MLPLTRALTSSRSRRPGALKAEHGLFFGGTTCHPDPTLAGELSVQRKGDYVVVRPLAATEGPFNFHMQKGFGGDMHMLDYSLWWHNIRENVRIRGGAWQNLHAKGDEKECAPKSRL